ncbi:protein spt2-like [Pyrus ussuriensis x Pyrus communis]|uniref:Protein spt2-like n=1 Tax=Pyrus ussuriensis x Pyrus communis TaxID=2448454 RepID=A0A5N5GR57_9ROSA|nr:protein spt2-like [Pyrus ussuriensis x Pyrus communis]
MRGYDRDEYGQSGNEYEDYDDEEDGEESEEEDPKPTKEALKYLEFRERIKEQVRKKLKKEETGSSLANSSDKKKKLPNDNFGSFFGPSQPVIAERVIQERKSLEIQHLTSSATNSVHKKKSSGSTSAGSKSGSYDQNPKVINEAKTKVQKIKDTRDYSFLYSDNAEPPASAKDRPPQNASVPNSEVRSSQMATSSKLPSANNGRHVPSANNGRHVPSANNGRHVPSANNGRHVPSANNGRDVPGRRDERKPVSMNGQMHSKVGPNKLSSSSRRPDATSMGSRKQLGSNSGNGPGRPLETKRLPSKMPASTTERKASTTGLKNPMSGVPRPPPSKLQSSIPRQQLQQKKEVREPNKPKVLLKESSGLSRPQHVNKPQMQRQISSRSVSQERPPKKKPMRRHPDDDDPDLDFRSEIRKLFRQPERYASDDDDSDMEANFEDIMREERRSALIARKEDEEEARKIEEEERRERMAKLNRKRKFGH